MEDVAMRTVFDFTPLSRTGIGFDRMLDLLDEVAREPADNYPPYNIEKIGEDAYRLTLAVAGFTPEELSITAAPNLLVIAGGKAGRGEMSEEKEYLHQGIATRPFERQFTLDDHVKVAGASLNQGLLTIDLVREVPEAMKPRRIAIANGNAPQAVAQQQAA
jgi:molecular chaperone IbpA